MSNLMITLLAVFAFAAGLGLGLVLVMRPRRDPPPKADSTVYFGSDVTEDPDHPHDIERQGSHLVPAPSGSRFAGRDYENRYDGMADGEGGLDFASRPH